MDQNHYNDHIPTVLTNDTTYRSSQQLLTKEACYNSRLLWLF